MLTFEHPYYLNPLQKSNVYELIAAKVNTDLTDLKPPRLPYNNWKIVIVKI